MQCWQATVKSKGKNKNEKKNDNQTVGASTVASASATGTNESGNNGKKKIYKATTHQPFCYMCTEKGATINQLLQLPLWCSGICIGHSKHQSGNEGIAKSKSDNQ